MKKKLISFVSIFLVICMVISSIPAYAIAESEVRLDTPVTNAENKETITNPEFNAVSSSKVLDYVDEAEFESHKFVGRVFEDEELNSYVFQNEDGSRTAYFFSENVKYVDKDGIVQEKDIDLITIMNSFYEAGYYESAEYYRNLLDDEEYHFEKIQEEYPDTYNFLMSLEDNLANIGEY